MSPTTFPEVNARFSTPDGLEESQVQTISGFQGVVRGSVEGLPLIVVAWKPNTKDLEKLNVGGSIYVTVLGGLPPHFLSTSFAEAINIA